VLGTESRQALVADAVGEAHAPAAPRRDPTEHGIASVAWMPRTSTDQHGVLSFRVRLAERPASHVPHPAAARTRTWDQGPRSAQRISLRMWKSVPASARCA